MVSATMPAERFESTSRYDGYSWKPTLQSLALLDKARELLTEEAERAEMLRAVEDIRKRRGQA